MLNERLAEARQGKDDLADDLARFKEAASLSPSGLPPPEQAEAPLSKSGKRRAKRRNKALQRKDLTTPPEHVGSALVPPLPSQTRQGPCSSPVAALHHLLAVGSLEARFGPLRIGLALERLGQQLGSVSEGLARLADEAASERGGERGAEGSTEEQRRQQRSGTSSAGKHCLRLKRDSLARLGLGLDVASWNDLVDVGPEVERAVIRGRLLQLLEELVWDKCAASTPAAALAGICRRDFGLASLDTAEPAVMPSDSRVAAVCEAAGLVAASDRCRWILASGLLEEAVGSDSSCIIHEAKGDDSSAADLLGGLFGQQQQPTMQTKQGLKAWIHHVGMAIALGSGCGRGPGTSGSSSISLPPSLNCQILGVVRSALSLWVLVTAAHPLLEISVTRAGRSPPRDGQAAYVIKEVKGTSLGLKPCGGPSSMPRRVVLCSHIPGVRFGKMWGMNTGVEGDLLPEALVTVRI